MGVLDASQINGAALNRARREVQISGAIGWSDLLQRGRAQSSAERRLKGIWVGSPYAPLQRGRAQSSAERPCSCTSPLMTALLQRGRAQSSAERPEAAILPAIGYRLQRGRAQSSAESHKHLAGHLVLVNASTGPRSIERGENESGFRAMSVAK